MNSDKPSPAALRHARAWLKWLRRDAALFAEYKRAAELGAATRARKRAAWRANAVKQPKLPSDAALKWIREHD